HDHFRALDDLVRREGGSLIKTVWEGACFVFTEPVAAVRAALAMRGLDEPQLRIAVHRGSAIVATINDHLDYFGSTVTATARLLAASAADSGARQPRIVLSDAVAGDPHVVEAVSRAAAKLGARPRIVSIGSLDRSSFACQLEFVEPEDQPIAGLV